MLVRVYGTVIREDGNTPVMEAAYVRGWHLGQFDFAEYRVAQSEAKGKNLKSRAREKMQPTEPSADYYIKHLAPTEAQAQRIKDHFEREAKRKEAERELGDALQAIPEVVGPGGEN